MHLTFSSFLAIFMALTALSARAEVRTFTSKDGRTVDAEVVGLTKTTVLLKLASGGVQGVALTALSAADLDYLNLWQEAERKRKPASVSVTIKKDNAPGKPSLFGDKDGTTTTDVSYTLIIRNVSRRPVLDLAINVSKEIETNVTGGSGARQRKQEGSSENFTIGRMEANEEQVINCKPVTLTKVVTYEKIYHYAAGSGQVTSVELRATKSEARLKTLTVEVTGEGRVLWKN